MVNKPKPINTLEDLLDGWSKEAFCNCEHEKIEEHLCPFDQDTCNCCAYCQGQCEKLKADER